MSYKPGEDFFIRFSDKTGKTRDPNDYVLMIEKIRAVTVRDFGFDIVNYGAWPEARIVSLGELERLLSIQRIQED